MDPIGLTRAGILVPVATFLERTGAPTARILAGAGLPEWVVTEPETLIPTSAAARVLDDAARREGVEDLGLRSGMDASIESLGVFGRLVRRASTLRSALEALVRHHPTFSSNGRMWLEARGADHVALCQAFERRFDDGWRQANLYILMLMLGVIRLGLGPTWRPAEVTLQIDEYPGLPDVEAFRTARLRFAQPATAIVLGRELLDAPLAPSPAGGADADDVEWWHATAPARDFEGSIVQVIETLAWERYPSIQRTAQALGTSIRTLQRRLATAGCTHEALVGRARFAIATALLDESDARILDIALDLGYSDHAHFTRAFRRWSGCSPTAYRRAHRHDA